MFLGGGYNLWAVSKCGNAVYGLILLDLASVQWIIPKSWEINKKGQKKEPN